MLRARLRSGSYGSERSGSGHARGDRVLLSADGDRPVVVAAPRRRGTTPATCSRSITARTRPGSPSCCGVSPAPDDPGAVALIWADWQSCGADQATGSLTRCARSTGSASRSCGAASAAGCSRAACSSGSTPTSRSPADCTRGLPEEVRVDSPDQAAPVRERGPADRGRRPVRGHAGRGRPAAGAQCAVTLREPSPGNGFVNAHPMAHHRWMPSIAPGGPDALDELIQSGSASFEAARPGLRGDATLDLFEAPTPRNWRCCPSGRSSAATTGRSASPGTAAGCSPSAACPSRLSKR